MTKEQLILRMPDGVQRDYPGTFTGITREISDEQFSYNEWLLGTKRYWIDGREVSKQEFDEFVSGLGRK